MQHYSEIVKYYDSLMEAGYYDHEKKAQTLLSTVGQCETMLEVGIGTGRLVEEILKINPSCDITGIDFSPAMLEVARERLPDDVSLV